MNYGRGRDERRLGSDLRGGKVHRPAFSLSYLAVALVGDARNLYLLPPHLGSSSSSSLSRRRLPPPTRVSLGGAALRRHRRGLGSRLGTLPPPASQTRGRIRKKKCRKGERDFFFCFFLPPPHFLTHCLLLPRLVLFFVYGVSTDDGCHGILLGAPKSNLPRPPALALPPHCGGLFFG